ncbi:hypothetical protein ABC345_09825 [Shouchella sp. 1P09AA]|uniref:hypothetical protein n=1 Tax=unclassified Shouchella TaxID=2893065 RepID=UPI0039A2F2B8
MEIIVPICLALLLVGSVTFVAWTLSKKASNLLVKFIPVLFLEFAAIAFIVYGLVINVEDGQAYSILGISMILLAIIPLQITLRSHQKQTKGRNKNLN